MKNLKLITIFLIFQSCSKDTCGCSFEISIDTVGQRQMATGLLSDNSDAEVVYEPDEIRYKANLPNKCATYLGKTINVDLQGFRNGEKFGDETSSELLMTTDIIYTINGIKISKGVGGYTLILVGCY